MIHICFGLHDKNGRYSKFTGTAILSLLENTSSEVTIHILHDNTLSVDNRDKFIYLVGRYGQHVKFYNVERVFLQKFPEATTFPDKFQSIYSPATMYRFLIPHVFPASIDKVIYLDSDIVVNLDIEELWRVRLGVDPLGAVPVSFQNADTQTGIARARKMFRMCEDGGVKPEDYFNAGVLLINLRSFRDEDETLTSAVKSISVYPEYAFLDQDVLNYCFAARALKLPIKFNRAVRFERLEGTGEIDRKIYHYAGQNAVWSFNLDMHDAFNRLWMDYFIKTPWFNVASVGRLYESVKQMHIRLKQAMVQTSALMSGKTRVFFTMPENLEATKEVFALRDDEEIILAENQDSLKNLLVEMKTSQGKKVFFIMVTDFPFSVLTEAGFVRWRDFLNGFEFLSEAEGFPLDSHRIIKAM